MLRPRTSMGIFLYKLFGVLIALGEVIFPPKNPQIGGEGGGLYYILIASGEELSPQVRLCYRLTDPGRYNLQYLTSLLHALLHFFLLSIHKQILSTLYWSMALKII